MTGGIDLRRPNLTRAVDELLNELMLQKIPDFFKIICNLTSMELMVASIGKQNFQKLSAM